MEQEPKTTRERASELISLLVPTWRPTPWQGLWAIRIGIVLGLLVAIGYSYGVTLWDWIKLLIVPAAIAGAGYWFNTQQREREQRIASDRAQDEALQAYLDKMSELLLDNQLQKEGDPYHETRVTARAQTLAVLGRLHKDRKRIVLIFLREARLISRYITFDERRNVLYHAHSVGLGDADLRNADLKAARLTNPFRGGPISLRRAMLEGASLSQANLAGADLRDADLTDTNLIDVELSGTDLTNADLTNADLTNATLRGAQGVTEQQLALCKSLEGATMPNGQKYEDWLKV